MLTLLRRLSVTYTAVGLFSLLCASAADARGRIDDPEKLRFVPSGVEVSRQRGQVGGDPFLVRQGGRWLMFYWQNGRPASSLFRTAASVTGPWSPATRVLSDFVKPCILVDSDGAAVMLGGKFHMYAVSFISDIAEKEIWHFTASSLVGPWVRDRKVIAKGRPGTKDDFFTDTPYALFMNGTVYLWYMGAPSKPVDSHGLATRILRATGHAPEGPFVRETTDVIAPASTGWDAGWMGGVQIRRRPGGGYMMIYNAGDTRPPKPGHEPNTSRVGYASSRTLEGPWLRDRANPRMSPSSLPGAIESSNIWRGHLALDGGKWTLFYNAGSGTEVITFATGQ